MQLLLNETAIKAGQPQPYPQLRPPTRRQLGMDERGQVVWQPEEQFGFRSPSAQQLGLEDEQLAKLLDSVGEVIESVEDVQGGLRGEDGVF